MSSKPQMALKSLIKTHFPGRRIYEEAVILGNLRLDFIIPSLRLAFEFDGEGHHEYIPFFHGNVRGFLAGQERDIRKDQWCKDNYVTLIRLNYEDLEPENFAKLLESIGHSMVDNISLALKHGLGDPYPPRDLKAEAQTKKLKEYHRGKYLKAKELRKKRNEN